MTESVRSFHTPHDAGDLRLTAQFTLRTDLTGDPRHLGGERGELVDHRVDGVLQLQHLAGDMDGHLARQITLGHRRRDESNVTHLGRQPGRHGVDGFREVLPRTRHSAYPRLAAELALRTDLTGHSRDLVGKGGELVHQPVDGPADLQEFTPQRVLRRAVRTARAQIHPLFQVALGHRRQHPSHLGDRSYEVVDQRIRGVDRRGPGALGGTDLQPFRELSLTADDPAHPRQLAREVQIAVRDLVEDRCDLRHDAVAGNREPFAEVPVPHGNQRDQQPIQRSRIHLGRPVVPGSSAFRACACAPRRCARLHVVPPAGSTVLPGLSLDTCPVFHHGPTRP